MGRDFFTKFSAFVALGHAHESEMKTGTGSSFSCHFDMGKFGSFGKLVFCR